MPFQPGLIRLVRRRDTRVVALLGARHNTHGDAHLDFHTEPHSDSGRLNYGALGQNAIAAPVAPVNQGSLG
jgi:hypothetical protein